MPYYPPNQQGRETEKQPDRAARKTRVRLIALLVSVLLIAGGGIPLGRYIADYFVSRRTADELRKIAGVRTGTEEVPEETAATVPPAEAEEMPDDPVVRENETKGTVPNVSPEPSEKLPAVAYPGGGVFVSRIHKLQQKSGYIFGWLKMESVDEPVAWKDHEFFLTRDATGKKNANGAIFMDEDTDLSTRPYTILLYGHNMKTGAMFGSLRKFEDFAYCYARREIQFDTLYEEGTYEIFAVGTIHLTPGRSRYVSLADLRSDNRAARKTAIKALISCSAHGPRNDVSEEDQILLLVTCTGDDDERLVVAAKRVDP